MATPLVSVKMITYNHEPYIRQAIDCVLAQKTNFPFELVIGEDCSTDGTREIVFDYAKRYPNIIRVITSKQNVGMKKNGKRTFEACRGEYIAFCEGDDYWQRDDKLQIQVDYFNKQPECGLVYSDFDVLTNMLYKKSHIYNSEFSATISPNLTDIISKKTDIRTCTVLIKKNLMNKIIDKDPYLHQGENFLMGDTQMWAEVSLLSKIGFINESLSTYRLLEESATRSKNRVKSLKFSISDAEMHLYLCNKHKLSDTFKKRYETNWRRSSLHLAFIEKDILLAESIKEKAPDFSLKDLVWYFGVKNSLLRLIILSFQKLRGK